MLYCMHWLNPHTETALLKASFMLSFIHFLKKIIYLDSLIPRDELKRVKMKNKIYYPYNPSKMCFF